jgi:WD40 repeat protein
MSRLPVALRPALLFAGLCAFAVALLACAARPVRAADEPEKLYTLAADSGGGIGSAQFSSGGKSIFTIGRKPNVGVWDVKTGKRIKTIEPPDSGYATGLNADGSRGVGFVKDAVVVWDLAAGKQLVELKSDAGAPERVRLSPDGARAVGVKDKTALVWEVKTGKLLSTLTGHKGPIASAEFSADGARVATGSFFGEIKIWDAKTGKEELDLKGMSTSNNPTAFSADGKLIVSPRFESPAVWSAEDGKELQEFKGHKGWCRTAVFSPTADRIVTAGSDATARVWDVKRGTVLHTMKHDGEVSSASFSPDGTSVLTLSAGKVHVWRLPAGK